MTDPERIAALLAALQRIRECAGQPAAVYRIATLALDAHNPRPTP